MTEMEPEDHYPVWRDIGWYDLTEGPDIVYAEIEVCGRCVPKHSHFARRALVPEWPCDVVCALPSPSESTP